MKHQPFVEFQPILLEYLRDPEEAAAYLNAALEDGDFELIIQSLKDVAEAQGGLDQIAKKIHFIAA